MRRLSRFLLVVALALVSCTGGDDATVSSTAADPPAAVPDSTTTSDPFALPDVGSFVEQEVTVGSDPYPLPGTVRLPADASPDAPVPGVVIVHGSGPQDEDGTVLGQRPYRDLSEGLADRGVAVLTYEKRTRAYADQFGDGARYTVQDETIDDAVSAVEVLGSTEGVDRERIYLAGHGLGALVAPRIALGGSDEGSDGETAVAGVVLLAPPARPLEELIVEQFRYLAEIDGSIDESERAQIEAAQAQLTAIRSPDLSAENPGSELLGFPGDYWLDLRGYDPVVATDELGLPVLVLWGERDYQVTATDFGSWQARAEQDEQITVSSFPGLNHNFVAGEGPSSPDDYARVGTVDPDVVDALAEFVTQ